MTKKEGERYVVQAFLESLGLPQSSLLEWERERPDALIKVSDRIVGVELTALSEASSRGPTPPPKWTAEARRVVQAAQSVFESRRATSMIVRFDFRPEWVPPSRKAFGTLAGELADIVEAEAVRLTSESTRPVQLRNPHLAIRWVYIARSSLGVEWRPAFGFSGSAATEADVKATVARKEPELVHYRVAASEVWLLIYCSLTGQGVSLGVPSQSFRIATGFNRVWCSGFGLSKWIEMQCVDPATIHRTG